MHQEENNSYFKYALKHIPCNFGKNSNGDFICKCPSGTKGEQTNYSFHFINEKHNFIYISIPKVASTTLLNSFFLGHKHSLIEPQKKIKEYLKFTFVRNPWSRMISNYIYWTTNPARISQLSDVWQMTRANNGNLWKRKIENLNDFLDMTKKLNNHHWEPQINFCKNFKMDFIGRFENLQQDINIVCDKIGIPRKQLPHTNNSKHKHYTEYYDDETRSIVAERYVKDIEYFGYKFGE